MLPFLRIGDFYLPTYGLLVASAFLVSLWLIGRLARRQSIDPDAAMNLGIYAALGGIAASKLFMIALDWEFYSRNPLELLSLTTLQAGGIFFGGLIGALLVAFLYMRAKRLPFAATADVFAPGVALGHGIGRLGCFCAGCCWGAHSDGPIAVTFTHPEAQRLFGTPLNISLHPTQIYEAAAEILICALLLWRIRKPHGHGSVIGLYLMLYPAARFAVEFVRAHDQANPYLGPFVTEQWIALGLLGLGLYLILRARKQAALPEPAAATIPKPPRTAGARKPR